MKKIALLATLCLLATGPAACGGDKKAGPTKAAAKKGKDTKNKDAKKADAKKADAKKADAKKADAKGDGGGDTNAGGAPEGPMASMLVRHEVEDFDKWKKGFDEHEAQRKKAGVLNHALLHEEGKPNNLLVGIMAKDAANLKKFAESDEIKKAMKAAGVKGKPDITFMETVEMKPPKEDTKVGALVKHKVKDFDAWKKAFDSHADKRKEASVVGHGVHRIVDDPNGVVIHVDATDIKKLKDFVASDDLKKVMADAGVEGKPEITFFELVEIKRYEDAAGGAAGAPAGAPPGGSAPK